MDFVDGYRLWAPTWDDLEPAAEVLAADDLDDAGQVVLDTGFLRGQWERSGFDLTTDAWVAVDGAGTLVGYGQVTRDGDDVVASWGVVHPAHRRRGIGAVLLGRIEARATELMAGVHGARFRHSVNAGDEAAAAMLQSRGLHLVRHFWHMGIELSPDVVESPAPAGIAIDSLTSHDDLPKVHAVLDEAFADHWGYEPESFEHWVQDQTHGPDYDPTLWRLAWEDGRLVGALTAAVRGDKAWVTELGVRREARGRGIAAALLRWAFAAFAARGIRSVVLVVDAANPTGATALYEGVGMRVVKRFDLWERTLDPAAPAAHISVMLAVPDAQAAAAWYERALGAERTWDLGSVVGLRIRGAPIFLGEPAANGWESPSVVATTTCRVEMFCDDPDVVIAAALEAGAEEAPGGLGDHRVPWGIHRQGGFVDPFGHLWLVGDRSPLAPHGSSQDG